MSDDDDLGPRPKDWLLMVSALFVGAKLCALRGQPLNNGDLSYCVEIARKLIAEVERRSDV